MGNVVDIEGIRIVDDLDLRVYAWVQGCATPSCIVTLMPSDVGMTRDGMPAKGKVSFQVNLVLVGGKEVRLTEAESKALYVALGYVREKADEHRAKVLGRRNRHGRNEESPHQETNEEAGGL